MLSLLIANDFLKLGHESRSLRMGACGNTLIFDACPVEGRKFLKRANFCRERQCAMCIWRRARLVASQVKTVCHTVLQRHSTYRFLFLTLTVPNVSSANLEETITHLMESWKRLAMRKEFGRIKGYFRALEVKYSESRQDWHPHFHCILCVPPSYFNGGNYVKRDTWLRLWQEATRQPEVTQVDIRAIRPKQEGGNAVEGASAEVAKYSVKMDELATLETEHRREVLRNAHGSLKYRRLYAFGGLLKQVHQELNLVQPDQATSEDLVNFEQETVCTCDICGSELQEAVFYWVGDNYYQK